MEMGRSVCDWFREDETFEKRVKDLESGIARQVSGFPTTSIRAKASTGPAAAEGEDEGVLYEQQFLMYPKSKGKTVKDVLAIWEEKAKLKVAEGESEGESDTGVRVVEFLKWTVGGESVVAKE